MGKTHKSTQDLPELGTHGWCVTTAMLEPGTHPGEEDKRLRMVSGATYWTKWVSVSPEPLINEAPTVCQALGPSRRQSLSLPSCDFINTWKNRVSTSETGPISVSQSQHHWVWSNLP